MRITHDLGESISLSRPGGDQPLWRYVYGADKPKPFFHPLRTPAGFTLSLFEPHDHVWHRGLWFTIKYINGENFWEEPAEGFGTQMTPVPPVVSAGADGAVRIDQRLEWTRPGGAGVVFDEARRITHCPLSGDAYALDWDVALTARADLLLDRTPFTTWGGYGGLTFRGSRNWQKTRLLFADGSTSDRPTPVPSDWCDLSGVFDGGRDATGGIAIFDDPRNVRYPSPWYGSTGPGHYFNAAFLFNEPMTVAAGETLRLRYRALIHNGIWDADRLNAAYDDYVESGRDDA